VKLTVKHFQIIERNAMEYARFERLYFFAAGHTGEKTIHSPHETTLGSEVLGYFFAVHVVIEPQQSPFHEVNPVAHLSLPQKYIPFLQLSGLDYPLQGGFCFYWKWSNGGKVTNKAVHKPGVEKLQK
jgi:hypothetical protein